MKEKLLALLVAKFKGVPEATLLRIASKKAGSVSDETELQSIADGIDYGQILQSEVDSKVTESNQKAVLNYETKHSLKDGKAVEKKVEVPPVSNTDDIASIVANAVSAAIAPISQELSEMKTKGKQATLKATLLQKLKEKGISETDVKTFNLTAGITIESEEEIEEQVTSIEARHNESKQALRDSGNYADDPSSASKAGAGKSEEELLKLMNGDVSDENGTVKLDVSDD